MSDRNVQSRTAPRKGKADAWMPLYVADYLADTTHLSTEEHGAYLLLLMAAWKRGGRLPVDDKQLAAIARMKPAAWRRVSQVILAFFHPDDGGLVQKRMMEEIERAAGVRDRRKNAGQKGAEARWPGDGKRMANAWQNDRQSHARCDCDCDCPSLPSQEDGLVGGVVVRLGRA